MMDIVVWGCNPFSELLYKLFLNSDINILAFVDKSSLSSFCGKPLYDPNEFKKLGQFTDISIVIATPHNISNDIPIVDFESIQQFKIKFQELVCVHGIENCLLHPAALIDILNIRYPNKIITFGKQGSGNTIFNHILLKISEWIPYLDTVDTAALFFEKLCYEYTQIVHQVMSNFLDSKNAYHIHAGPWKIGMTSFHCLFDEKKDMSIFSFPTRDHIIGRTYGYHTLPSQKYFEYLESKGFNIFFIMRNPLDIMVSVLNKSNRIDHQTGEIQIKPFYKMAQNIIRWFDISYPIVSQMKVIKYESLIKNPILVMRSIVKQLNISFSLSISIFIKQFMAARGPTLFLPLIRNWIRFLFTPFKKFAKATWDTLGFKELTSLPNGHFWSGGNAKWEIYFKKEHLLFLKIIGIEELLRKFGYNDVLDRFKVLTSTISETEIASYFPQEFINSLNLSKKNEIIDEHYNTYQYLCNIYTENRCVQLGGFNIGTNDSIRLEDIKDIFEDKFINRILLAGLHPEFKHFLD